MAPNRHISLTPNPSSQCFKKFLNSKNRRFIRNIEASQEKFNCSPFYLFIMLGEGSFSGVHVWISPQGSGQAPPRAPPAPRPAPRLAAMNTASAVGMPSSSPLFLRPPSLPSSPLLRAQGFAANDCVFGAMGTRVGGPPINAFSGLGTQLKKRVTGTINNLC